MTLALAWRIICLIGSCGWLIAAVLSLCGIYEPPSDLIAGGALMALSISMRPTA